MSDDVVSYARSHGPGHAFLDTGMPVPDGARVAIKRLDVESRSHLGPGGWQDAPGNLEARQVGPTRLLLGPTVCNVVPSNVETEIAVTDPAGNTVWQSGTIFWPEIRRSGRASDETMRILDGRPAQRAGNVPPRSGPLPPSPAKEPSPRRSEAAARLAAAGYDGSNDDFDPIPAEPLPDRRWFWAAIAGSALVTILIAVAVWLYFPRDIGSSLNFSALTDLECRYVGLFCSETAAAPSGDNLSGAPSGPSRAEIDALIGEGPDRVAALLDDPSQPLDILRGTGQRLRESGHSDAERDLGYRLLYEAGNRGDQEALLWIAKANDPSLPEMQDGRGARANPQTAMDFYRKAVAAGDASARQSIASLCNWLAGRRFGGDLVIQGAYERNCISN